MTSGMRGELYAATGVNSSGLWLHYNWLPALDQPEADAWTPFVLLTDILETCEDIDEVEARLRSDNRQGGMLIFSASPDGQAAGIGRPERQEVRDAIDGRPAAHDEIIRIGVS